MVACFHCCHEIPTKPMSMPKEYDPNTQIFSCSSEVFCSWECMKSYNLYSNDFLKNNRFELIQMMYTKQTGKHDKIKFAPKRELLSFFGGNMSIEQFRTSSTSIIHNNVSILKPSLQSNNELNIKKKLKKGFNLVESMGLVKV